MYTYHHPIIGINISNFSDATFFHLVYNVAEEFDYSHASHFSTEDIDEFVGENENDFDLSDSHIHHQVNLAKLFYLWVQDNAEVLDLKRAYHGGLDTPIYFIYNESSKIPYKDTQSYALSNDDLKKVLLESENFSDFCRDSMDQDLFDFLNKQKCFGLQFVSCSS